MTRFRSLQAAVAVLSLSTSVALADALVEQKTRVQFGGVVGAVANVFGGKATRDGITSSTAVKGNRMLTTNGRTGQLVDLSEEKVYDINFDRKTYGVTTFAELRKQYEDARKEMEAETKESKGQKQEGPEYDVDFDVNDTGKRETINGFNARQVIVTVTVREKGKKLEESGGFVLTSDMWMGPKIPAMREINDFHRRYFQKLYGNPAAEMQQMAVLMATTPAFGKAMKVFSEKKNTLDGEPVRTNLTFETVAAPGQRGEASEASAGSATPSAVVGGLLRGALKKRQEAKSPETANRSKMFDSSNEVLRADSNAGDVSIPAGFKQK